MDLIRELLLLLEEQPLRAGDGLTFSYGDIAERLPAYTYDQVYYHLQLLLEEGFIEPRDNQGMDTLVYSGMSWRGHDFLDSVREPERWKETKGIAAKVGGWSLDLLTGIAKTLAKQELKKLGIDLGN
jgi:hypothetical protein